MCMDFFNLYKCAPSFLLKTTALMVLVFTQKHSLLSRGWFCKTFKGRSNGKLFLQMFPYRCAEQM